MVSRSRSRSKRIQEATAVVDRLSSLPVDILHTILLRCSTADAARTASLSKRWASLWATFPRLDLDEDRYQDRNNFVQGMELSLLNRVMAPVRELRIVSSSPFTEHDVASEVIVDVVHAVATLGCLQKVQLIFTNELDPYDTTLDHDYDWFLVRFPQVLFTHGRFLRSLVIIGCRFEPCLEQIKINLPLLTNLAIRDAFTLDQKLLPHLLHSCPSLQHFSVAFFRGLESIHISHPKLLSLEIRAWKKLGKIQGLDLPNLKSFHYIGYIDYENENDAQPIDAVMTKLTLYGIIDLSLRRMEIQIVEFLILKFNRLKKLEFRSIDFKGEGEGEGEGDEMLCITGSSYPCLVQVVISHCRGAKYLRVLSSTVEQVLIDSLWDIEECLILAPCLKAFEYEGLPMKFSMIGRDSVPELLLDNVTVPGNDVLQLVRDRDLIHSLGQNLLREMKLIMLHNDSLMLTMFRLYHRSRHLEVYIKKRVENLQDCFIYLLSMSPIIMENSITVHLFESFDINLEFNIVDSRQFLIEPRPNIVFVELPCVANITKINISKWDMRHKEMKFLEWLVKKAVSLEQLVITTIQGMTFSSDEYFRKLLLRSIRVKTKTKTKTKGMKIRMRN